jgi:glycolate oxidase FAD binding subunit
LTGDTALSTSWPWPDSPAGGTLGDGRHATFTDHPPSLDALRQAVVTRVDQGLAIYPQGGGTALNYGGIPRVPGVAIDTRGLNQVIDYPAADMTITVEAGITLAALRAVLAEKQQRLLVDAPEADRATLGGIYATNTSGPRRFGSGRPRDQIIGVSFVNAEGAVIKGGGRVVKNVAGYDFPKLLTGSLGTLGILTQMTLKVRPVPEASALVWTCWPGVEELAGVLDRLNTSATRPVAVELLNPGGAHLVGGRLGLPAAGWALAIGFEDNAGSVAWQLDQLRAELLHGHGGADVALHVRGEADFGPLWSALTEFPVRTPGPVSFLANLRPSSVVAFVSELDPGLWAVQAHAGNGIVRGHALEADSPEAIAPELDRLRAWAVRDGGNLILPRCPTAWKAGLRVWGEPRPDWTLAERVKHALDPKGVMNPGRFVATI